MKKHLIPIGATLLVVLLVAGCETDNGISARTQEKSAVYATLQQWQKNYIAKGVIAHGFTPDMVYMAVGRPSKVEARPTTAGGLAELWTYTNYYPSLDAAHMQHTSYSTDAPYQPAKTQTVNGRRTPVGMGDPQSIGTTGPPQGQLPEPADLQSYTLIVLYQEGKVARIAVNPN